MQKIINPSGKDVVSLETEFCGHKLSLEVNRLGFRADAAVLVRHGDTVVLGTVGVGKPVPGGDYFPLSVDYEERFYASGKISGSRYVKREGRPSEDAILIGRLIDRPIRPLFPKGYRNEVQAVATVLSMDPAVKPDMAATVAISAAMKLAGLPFDGPVASVRVGYDQSGQLKPITDIAELESNRLNIVVASKSDGVMMVEAGASEVSEEDVVEAIEIAYKEAQSAIEIQNKLVDKVGVDPQEYELSLPDEEVTQAVAEYLDGKMGEKLAGNFYVRSQAVSQLEDDFSNYFSQKLGEDWDQHRSAYMDAFSLAIDKDVRLGIIESSRRPDGRAMDEVRPLSSQVGVLPRTHGSAIFTRGATQALNIVTLAAESFAQSIETMERETEKYYMHHYNAPGYTTGDIKRMGSPGRREIGHSALAERALLPVLPSQEDFPYTIRSVTEIMSQHGSTSMAATCSSCLALMDAGVPITRPVSGVAMGLIVKEDGSYVVLTDIQDAEDFAGDMDFKVTGTSEGITALQMDMKVHGLKVEVLKDAINQGKLGRAKVLDHMVDVLSGPRQQMSQYAPRVEVVKINPDKIRDLIGKGGETIQGIIKETGADIDIKDDGNVLIFSNDSQAMEKTKQMIKDITAEPEVGTIYRQRPVVKVMDFGAFVNIMPGTDGMVHVSEMAETRVEHPSDVVKEGDLVDVKLMAIDDRGRLSLSMSKAKD